MSYLFFSKELFASSFFYGYPMILGGMGMYLNSGSCLELFNMMKSHGTTQAGLYDAIFSCIDPDDETDYIPSNIKAGRADVPGPIKEALSDADRRPEQIIRFRKKVMPLIEENLEILLGAFILFLEKDRTVPNTITIANRKASEWKGYEGTIFPESFLLGVLAFAFSRGNRCSNALEGLNASFLEKARRKGKRLSIQEDSTILSPLQFGISEDARFQAVFHEVPLSQTIDKVRLRLFYLDPDCNRYSYEGLVRHFRENLFRHVHTLNEINGYNNEGKTGALHLDARTKLKERYMEEHGDVLETLIVESCITDASNAPKIVNLLEHDNNGIPSGSHGIHYMKRTNSAESRIIVAISAMKNDGNKAIVKAFSDIAGITASNKIWKTKLFSQSSLLSKMPPEDAKLIANTFMPKTTNQKTPQIGYGIFIGYSGEAPDGTDTLSMRLSREALELANAIQKEIGKNKLESVELGFYFIPFNNPEEDKIQIVEEVLQ